MEIDGYRAIIQYDPEIDMFRGEFVGLNGGADFYAKDIAGLKSCTPPSPRRLRPKARASTSG